MQSSTQFCLASIEGVDPNKACESLINNDVTGPVLHIEARQYVRLFRGSPSFVVDEVKITRKLSIIIILPCQQKMNSGSEIAKMNQW